MAEVDSSPSMTAGEAQLLLLITSKGLELRLRRQWLQAGKKGGSAII